MTDDSSAFWQAVLVLLITLQREVRGMATDYDQWLAQPFIPDEATSAEMERRERTTVASALYYIWADGVYTVQLERIPPWRVELHVAGAHHGVGESWICASDALANAIEDALGGISEVLIRTTR